MYGAFFIRETQISEVLRTDPEFSGVSRTTFSRPEGAIPPKASGKGLIPRGYTVE
jgi:hypothetical protein